MALATKEIQIPENFERTLEQIQDLPTTEDFEGQALADVIKVSEMEGDSELIAEAQRNIKQKLVGDLAVRETIKCAEKPIKDLREGIIWASKGDQEGLAMVDANISTEMIEQVYKAGNVITVKMNVDGDDIYQHGQRMADVQRNAYHLASDDPIIKPRTVAEANNVFRMKRLYDEGLLEDNVFVRFSMCAEGVSDDKLDELKFFSSTKSISVQMAYSKNGELFDEIAMVAGVKDGSPDRHDREMVEGVAKHFGHSYENMSAPEIIDDGFLVPKKYVKNGVVDFVKIMDDVKGGTFFGQAVPRQDYIKYKEFCENRAARFKEDAISVREQLVSEVDDFRTAIDASIRLSKLVEARMVDRALTDKSIDPIVFGEKSADNLVRARQLVGSGYFHEAQAFMQVARATAQGGSCPSAMNSKLLKELGIEDPMQQAEEQSRISKENAWAGTENPVEGTCVNCDKKTKVGVKSWCKGCIKGHCG